MRWQYEYQFVVCVLSAVRRVTAVHRTIILSAIICGCETWSLTMRDERG